MPTMTMTGSASFETIPGMTSAGGSTTVSGLNDDEGFVTDARSTMTLSFPDNTTIGNVNILHAFVTSIGATFTLTFAALPQHGGTFGLTHGGYVNVYSPKPNALVDSPSTFVDVKASIFAAGIHIDASFSVEYDYTRVRVTSIVPATLDPAGGQLVTLSGDGFSPITCQVPALPGLPVITQHVIGLSINGVDATDVIVVNDHTITFLSPPNIAAPPDTYQLLIQYEVEEIPGQIALLPLAVPFFVTYGGGPALGWCYNPTSNRYVYAAECPGAPFVSSDPPVPTITGFHPRST